MPIFPKEGSNTANLQGSEFYGKGNSSPNSYRSPAKTHEEGHEEKAKNIMGGTKENPTWTKSKGGKSSTYTVDTKYKHKDKGTRWVNKEGGSFITTS